MNEEAFNVIFNDQDAKKVNRDASKGLVIGSAVNFYGEDITEADVDDFYSKLKSPDPDKPLSFGLNSKLIKTIKSRKGSDVKSSYTSFLLSKWNAKCGPAAL